MEGTGQINRVKASNKRTITLFKMYFSLLFDPLKPAFGLLNLGRFV